MKTFVNTGQREDLTIQLGGSDACSGDSGGPLIRYHNVTQANGVASVRAFLIGNLIDISFHYMLN